ncbi:MAG TPA: ABC transporter ATP-binding protein [Roseburia sp.]|nr:ABC transporter ATP-binding protein [Roseburia sp.]
MGDEAKGIRILHVRKEFEIEKQKVQVLKDIDLEIYPGEIVSIVGGSGCGKSTLLRMIAGLDQPTEGEILIDGKKQERPSLDVGVLFQESRLLPWENTRKNIEFGLPEDFPKKEKKELAEKYMEMVGLKGFEKALPGQLSGGMQKRTAIARTLINRPHILLLDEPFGALDAFTRINLQKEILRIWKQEKMTIILVTHDIDEAIFMGNRVVVMSPKPGVVKKIYNIELPMPKSRTDEDFGKLRSHIYNEFLEREKVPEDYII